MDKKEWPEVMAMAMEILALKIPESEMVFAERMAVYDEDRYSPSFYESAVQINSLLESNYSLTEAVRVVGGYVKPLEDLEIKLVWGTSTESVAKVDLEAYAAEILAYDIPGPDLRQAKRVTLKKAAKEEWKFFALRAVTSWNRITDFDLFQKEFFLDLDRNEKEFAVLRKFADKVSFDGTHYTMKTGYLPPWSDTDLWETFVGYHGFGPLFAPAKLCPEQVQICEIETNGQNVKPTQFSAAQGLKEMVTHPLSTEDLMVHNKEKKVMVLTDNGAHIM